MNSSSLALHLLLKDLRHQRAWLVLLWGYALAVPVMARMVNGTADGAMILAVGGLFLLVSLMLGRLIRLDPPGRELHFLGTRPVPLGISLCEKTLFIGMLLLVPVWIAKLGTVFMLRIPAGPLDVFSILIETTLSAGALLAAVMLGSLFFRNLWTMLFSAFGGFVLFLVCGAYFMAGSLSRRPMPAHAADIAPGHSGFLMFCAGIIVTAGVVAIVRYSRKSFLAPLGILMAGVTLSAMLWIYWPCDLGRLFAGQGQSAAELPPALRDRIKFALTDENGHGSSVSGGSYNSVRYFGLNHTASLEGVEPPYFAALVDYHSEATLKSGRTISSAYDVDGIRHMTPDLTDRREQEMAGFETHTKWDSALYEIFNYLPAEYEKEDLTGATVKGVLTLEISKLVAVKTMQFKPGGTVDMPRARYVVQNVDLAQNEANYRIVKDSVNSTLRGDYSAGADPRMLTWLVFNRSKNEYLGAGSRGGGSTRVFCNVETSEGELSLGSAHGEQSIPGDWADHAEITFFSTVPCGRISFPYEVKNVDLEH